jgi:hypothetical protein
MAASRRCRCLTSRVRVAHLPAPLHAFACPHCGAATRWPAGKYVVLFFYPLDFTFVCPVRGSVPRRASAGLRKQRNVLPPVCDSVHGEKGTAADACHAHCHRRRSSPSRTRRRSSKPSTPRCVPATFSATPPQPTRHSLCVRPGPALAVHSVSDAVHRACATPADRLLRRQQVQPLGVREHAPQQRRSGQHQLPHPGGPHQEHLQGLRRAHRARR